MKNTISKIISSTLTTIFAFIGLIVSGYAWLMHEVDAKDLVVVNTMRIERTAQLGTLKTEIEGVKVLVESVDGKVDILLQGRK